MTLFSFILGEMQWLIIALLAFLFFGNRLPQAMRSLGRGVTEFKKGLEGTHDDDEAVNKSSEPKKIDEQPAKT